MFLFWPGCYYTWRASQHRDPTWGYFVAWDLLPWSASGARGDFLGANSCPKTSSHSLWERIYLPLVPCTSLPLAWPSHESYLSQGPLWGDIGTSQVRLLFAGASTMALKPPFSLLSHCFSAWWARSLNGVTPSMVFPTHGYRGATLWMPYSGDILPLWRPTLATPWLGDAFSRQRLIWATLPLGDASPWSCLHLAPPHLGDALCWLWPWRWLWPWICQRPGTERYKNWKVWGVNDLKYGKGRLMENAFSLEWNINIDLVRPVKTSTLAGVGKVDKIFLVLNEFRYGVKGGRS